MEQANRDLREELTRLTGIARLLTQTLDHAAYLVGSNLVQTARALYQGLRTNGDPEQVGPLLAELGKRFKGQGPRKKKATSPSPASAGASPVGPAPAPSPVGHPASAPALAPTTPVQP